MEIKKIQIYDTVKPRVLCHTEKPQCTLSILPQGHLARSLDPLRVCELNLTCKFLRAQYIMRKTLSERLPVLIKSKLTPAGNLRRDILLYSS